MLTRRIHRTCDYLIIGSGSAGAVLAARLSERSDLRVLLIEAGGTDSRPVIRVPGLVEQAIADPGLNWNYRGDPDPTLDGRSLGWAAGRVIGGSSSINGMVYVRGLPADYDRWAMLGNAGWDWTSMLPFLRRLEHWTGPPHEARGQGGPLNVRLLDDVNAACRSTMDSLIALGVPAVDDYNIGIVEGIGITQASQKFGRRHSAADAYLKAACRRPNLTVWTRAQALQLLLADDRCIGARIEQRGRLSDVRAERETIVCAGAIGSPALLLRSGIGPPDALEPHGLPIAHRLPGVGRNLNDHVNVLISAFVDTPTFNTERHGLRALRHGLRWAARGSGPAASPANHCQAFVRTDASLPCADVQIQLMPLGFGSAAEMRRNGMTAVVSPCRPAVRGRVRLWSGAPDAAPRITMAMLESEHDRLTLLRGCRLTWQAMRDGPGRDFRAQIYAPGATELSDDDWFDYFRASAGLNWHPTSTCRMGSGVDDVVDSSLAVHGIEDLRIVDASVMPTVTSGNTNAPVIAIAERAAEFILQR